MKPLEEFTSKPQKKGKEIPLYVVAALFIIFIIGFSFFYPELIPSDDKNTTGDLNNTDRRTTTREAFLANLIDSENLAIVMTITGTTADQAALIYNCGVGFSGSWGSVGKNISNLDLYVIDGDACTYSTPRQTNSTNKSTEFSADKCTSDYADSTRFDIRFGPSSTIFTNRSAFVLIDQQFGSDCSFGIPRTLIESLEPVNLFDNLSTTDSDDSNKPFNLDDLINQRINKEFSIINITDELNSTESISNTTDSNTSELNSTESDTTESNVTEIGSNSTENVTE